MHSIQHELDLGGFNIHNVAPGVMPNDVVVVSQLNNNGVTVPGNDREIIYNDNGVLGARAGAKIKTFLPPFSSLTNVIFAATDAGDVDIAVYPFNYNNGLVKGFRIDTLGARLTFGIESYGTNPGNSAGFQLSPATPSGAAVFEGWDASEFSIQCGNFPMTFKTNRIERMRLTNTTLRWLGQNGAYAVFAQEPYSSQPSDSVGLQLRPPSDSSSVVFEGWDTARTLVSSSNAGGTSILELGTARTARLRFESNAITLLKKDSDSFPLRLEAGNGGNYYQTRAAATMSASYTEIQPASQGSIGQVKTISAISGSTTTTVWSTVRQVTTGGNAYEVLTKNPDGSDTYIWRIPDSRSVSMVAGDYLNYKLLLMRSTFSTLYSQLIVEATGKFGVSSTPNNSGVVIGIDGALVLTTNANDGTGISNTTAERAWTLKLVVTRTGTSTGLAEATIMLDGSTVKTRVPLLLSSQDWTTGNMQIDIQGKNNPDRVSIVRSYFWNAGAASLITGNTNKTAIPNGNGSYNEPQPPL